MLRAELPFHLARCARESSLRGGLAEVCREEASKVVLDALSISIETGGKTYDVISDALLEPDSAGPFRGTLWPRWLLALPSGMSIEQQVLLPAAGDALAISWRLIGRTLFPARLKVSPTFVAREAISPASFQIEPETNGGRLAWRPYGHSSKIIADTNGRCVGGTTCLGVDLAGSNGSPVQPGITPATFEFDLGSHPAVLIFSAERQSPADANPLIGGFLAQLAQQRTAMTEYDHRRDLIAA